MFYLLEYNCVQYQFNSCFISSYILVFILHIFKILQLLLNLSYLVLVYLCFFQKTKIRFYNFSYLISLLSVFLFIVAFFLFCLFCAQSLFEVNLSLFVFNIFFFLIRKYIHRYTHVFKALNFPVFLQFFKINLNMWWSHCHSNLCFLKFTLQAPF